MGDEQSGEGREHREMEYAVAGRRAPGTVPAMVLRILGVMTSVLGVGIVFGLVAMVTGALAWRRIQREPMNYEGLGFAKVGVGLGMFACVLGSLYVVLVPSLGCSPCLSRRSACAANLRGITQSMNVYAVDYNNVYPLLPYAPYRVVNSEPLAGTVTAKDGNEAVKSMFGGPGAQDGSVLASIWLMVLKNYTSPKQYLCQADPFVDPKRAGSQLTAGPDEWYVNFQSVRDISYSFAYPYLPDGKTGAWWKNTVDSSLPIASDMAPLDGTGVPVRKVAPGAMPADPKTWNSGNHEGEGQNVGFADGHAEFLRRPDCGQGSDNIFTLSGAKGVSAFGGMQPGKGAIEVKTENAPFDVVMVPARDLNTGGF